LLGDGCVGSFELTGVLSLGCLVGRAHARLKRESPVRCFDDVDLAPDAFVRGERQRLAARGESAFFDRRGLRV
jgi:hypothetical protein